MKIHDQIDQGSAEWLALRVGRVTASEAGQLLTPEFKIRTGDMPKTYLYSKLAETYRGAPLPGFSAWSTEQGEMNEDEARKAFCFLHEGGPVYNVAFCEHDDGRCGCSPDALIGDHSGLELKAPQAVNHVRYLVEGKLPDAYAVQVHFSMYVTGRPEWVFFSYSRKFPPFMLRVQRDPKVCETIREALAAFYERFDCQMEKLRNAS